MKFSNMIMNNKLKMWFQIIAAVAMMSTLTLASNLAGYEG